MHISGYFLCLVFLIDLLTYPYENNFPKMLFFQIVTICPLSLPSRSSRYPRFNRMKCLLGKKNNCRALNKHRAWKIWQKFQVFVIKKSKRSAMLHFNGHQRPHWACWQYSHTGETRGWLGVKRWELCLRDTSRSAKCHRRAEQQWVTGFRCMWSVVGWLIVYQLGKLSLSCSQ